MPIATIDSCILQAMEENGLDSNYRATVLMYLYREDEAWRRCCNSGCEPCMLQIGRTVDRARVLIADLLKTAFPDLEK